MNKLLERRSIRKYTEEPITEEQFVEVIKAGMYAPSSHNTQPWEFIIVQDKVTLDKLKTVSPYASKPLSTAPAAIIVLGNTKELESTDFLEQNLAACTENILLEATALGLGTCWIGIMPKQDCMANVRTIFQLPDHIVPFNIIAIGHPAVMPTADRFDKSRIHNEQY